MPQTRSSLAAIAAGAFVVALGAGPSHASLFHHDAKPAVSASADALVAEVGRAVNEERLADAEQLLDQAALAGVKDPRLELLDGELALRRGHFADALASFKAGEVSPATYAGAMEGEGIALSALGRSNEAVSALQKAVLQAPGSWRAWNALGAEYDHLRDWSASESAYDKALKASDHPAIVLNNRGYSRLLQHRLDEAVLDLVAALQAKPDLTEARTNLRLALAMKGDYGRAAEAGGQEDRAAILNNAGFAAALRGDYPQAEALLTQAMQAKSVFYDRASENLAMVRALAAKDKTNANAAH